MASIRLLLLTLLSSPLLSQAKSFCPPLGPVFPSPCQVSESSAGVAVAESLTAVLDTALKDGSFNGIAFDASNISFSIQFSSLNEQSGEPLFEYHHSAAPISLNASSTQDITRDSIYRIGSVSKLFIPYALLIAKGPEIFKEPIINFIPELKEVASKQDKDLNIVKQVIWKEVTLGALASHMSGLGNIFDILDVSAALPVPPGTIGLPQLNQSEIPKCGGTEAQLACNSSFLLQSIINRSPVHHTFETPGYSNPGIVLLAYALANITGKPWQNAVEDLIIKPLDLSAMSYAPPKGNITGVIPAGQFWWDTNLGDFGATGGIYTSITDLTSFALSILNNTLLPPAATRSWLKPLAHTSNPIYSLGAVWEIRRAYLDGIDDRTIDLYSKDGSLPPYTSKLALIPDFDAALTVIAAGGGSGALVDILSDLVAVSYLPVLEDVARDQAASKFSGTYTSKPSNSSTNSTSSITITTDDGPGLVVSSWSSLGHDVINETIPMIFQSPLDGFPRLYPSGLEQNGEIAWRAHFPLKSANDGLEIFSEACADWGSLDVLSYGDVGLDDFVFRTGADGSVGSVELRGWRVVLEKERGS